MENQQSKTAPQIIIEVDDLLAAKDHQIASAQRECAIALAKVNSLVRSLAARDARIVELEKSAVQPDRPELKKD